MTLPNSEPARRGNAPDIGTDTRGDGRFATTATTTHFEGHILSVRVDTVTMPGGGTARREIVDHLPAVGMVALDADGRVALIEQYRHPLRRRLWEIPAGLMDIAGESALDCAKRELREEIGQTATQWSVLVDLAVSPGYCTETIRVFQAAELRHVDAPPRTDEEADLTIWWVPLADAIDAIARGDIVNATAVAGLLAADSARRSGSRLRSADDDVARSEASVNREVEIGRAPAIPTASFDAGAVTDWNESTPAGGVGGAR